MGGQVRRLELGSVLILSEAHLLEHAHVPARQDLLSVAIASLVRRASRVARDVRRIEVKRWISAFVFIYRLI